MSKPPRLPAKPLLQDPDASIKGQRRRRRNPEQPSLPFDTMPDRIEPCLALLKSKPPIGPEWLFEIKWDGYRIAVHIAPNDIRILTRGGVFMYPRDAREPEKPGKLRLLYEANPMSFLVEQAGGAATDGRMRILDIAPDKLHQRVAVFLGSKNEVERVTGYHA